MYIYTINRARSQFIRLSLGTVAASSILSILLQNRTDLIPGHNIRFRKKMKTTVLLEDVNTGQKNLIFYQINILIIQGVWGCSIGCKKNIENRYEMHDGQRRPVWCEDPQVATDCVSKWWHLDTTKLSHNYMESTKACVNCWRDGNLSRLSIETCTSVK